MLRKKDVKISLFDFIFSEDNSFEITLDVENESDENIYVYFSDIKINDNILLKEQVDDDDYVLELSYDDIMSEDNGFPVIDFYHINDTLYKKIKKISFNINVEQDDDQSVSFSKKYEIDINIKKRDYSLKNDEYHEKWSDFFKNNGYPDYNR